MKKFVACILLMLLVCLSACPVFADVSVDPAVTIVNPTEDTTISTSNLLISVKVAKKATITVEIAKEVKVEESDSTSTTKTATADTTTDTTSTVTYELVGEKETFVSTTDLSFYTKKIENVEPANYKVTVNTIDQNGTILYQSQRLIKVEPKQEEVTVFNSNQSGTFTFLQNLLKTIFGN